MPTFLSQSDFAKTLKVTRQAVGQAVKAGRLTLDEQGRIDLDSDQATTFRNFHRMAAKASGKGGRGRPVRGGAAPAIQSAVSEYGDPEAAKKLLQEQRRELRPPRQANDMAEPTDADTIAAQTRMLDVHLKRIKAAKERIFYDELTKRVIPYEVAAHCFNALGSAIEQEFKNFDVKNVDMVCDAVASGKARTEISEMMRMEIEKSIKNVKRATHAAIEQLREDDE